MFVPPLTPTAEPVLLPCRRRWSPRAAAVLLLWLPVWSGCGVVPKATDRLLASNHRDWAPMFRQLPYAEIQGEQIALRNIRNFQYLTEDDYLVQYYDRTFQISEIQSVDFIMVPFQGMEEIAHTMLSFGLADGTYLSVSVEVRTEKGEHYSTSLGGSNEFEITYVVADERDVIRLRTRYRHADVYVYPSTATPEAAQKLFLDMMQRVNDLYAKPEFYNTLRNNCTTNLVRHINRVFPRRIPLAWPVLLSGYSDEYAYQLGLLDNTIPFDELKAAAYINPLAEKYFDDPDFSQKIRLPRASLSRRPVGESGLPRAGRPLRFEELLVPSDDSAPPRDDVAPQFDDLELPRAELTIED